MSAEIQKLYIAYFNRPADPGGLAYWTDQLAKGASMTQIANSFSASAEYQAIYNASTNFELVVKLYQNLFGRTPVAGEASWWSNQITASGNVTITTIANQLASGTTPGSADNIAIINKISAATAYTTAIDTTEEIINYKGNAVFAKASAWLAPVKDAATLATAIAPAALNAAVADAVASGTASGSTFTLTTGADTTTHSSANQTVVGLVSATATLTTFNATDVIVDGTSTDADVFTLTTEADLTAANTALVRGIETVNVNADATTLTDTNLDFAGTNFAGVKTFNFDVIKPQTAISGLVMTATDINNVVVNASDKFSAASFAGTAGKNVTINARALGTAGTPTAVTVTNAMADVTATGLGNLSVTSNASLGLLSATAAKNLTVSGTAAQMINATATDGNVTISDATASLLTTVNAKGNVSILTLDGVGSKLTVTAGGTITLDGATAANTNLNTISATLSGVGTSTIGDADLMTSLTLSGNGGKATYVMTAGSAALSDVNVTGASEVVLQLSAASVETLNAAGGTGVVLTVNDTGSGLFNLELGTAAGTVDLRGGSVDKLTVAIDNDSKILSVKSGQVVTYKVAQTDTAGGTATTVEVGTNANAASNAVTIRLDDEVKDANAVAITALTVTQAKTVTIDASVDATAGGSAVTHSIVTLIASGANSNVTINGGANNIDFGNAGATTAGTGTISVTGSGTLTDAVTVTSLTAAELNASAMTGKVTLNSTTALNVGTIRTGTNDDILVLTSTALDQTVSTGAGDDIVTLQALDGTKIVSIDMGAGANDRLKFTANNTKLTGTSVSLAGVETIEFADQATQQIKASLLNGATYKIDATAANVRTVDVIVGSTDTAVNLSSLVGSIAAETAVAGMTFAIDANANTALIAITGAAGTKNSITGSSVAGDVLTGGTREDTFNYSSSALLFTSNVMNDTIVGGSGTSSPSSSTQLVDAINFTATAAAVTVASADSFAKATGIESITTAANTGAISLTLGATAQTAGIISVNLAGDTDNTGANVVNVSAFTTGVTIVGGAGVETITGGSGNDTITGGAGIDVISAGDGNDTIILLTTATAVTGNALIDSINGGAGTDTLQVGTNGADFTLAAADSFARMSLVETIRSVANTNAVSITTHANVYDAGVRTIDISASTHATGGVINVDAFTTGQDVTLIGSATGVTTFTGGAGVDTMSGGTANDVFTGKEGADIISMAAGGTDVVDFGTALADGIQTVNGFTAGLSSVTGFDTIKAGGTTLTAAPTIAATWTLTKGLIYEINVIFSGTGLAGVSDGSALIAALTASAGTAVTVTQTAASDAQGYIVAYQDSKAYVYYYDNNTTNNITAAEIGLIGVLNNVNAGALESANFVA